jgi:hypothetical protein
MSGVRRWGIAVLAGGASVVVAAATAWACVSGPAVSLSTVQAKAGDEVTLTGTNFRQAQPVTVRWNSLDGPVLATLPPPDNRNVAGTFTVPPGTVPGDYVVIVTQMDESGKIVQMPIRALLTVVGANGATPVLGQPISAPEERPVGLATADESLSGGAMVLIALGVGGLGMFLAGAAALWAGRRSPAPTPAPAPGPRKG